MVIKLAISDPTGNNRTLLIPNFCLDLPFGFSVHKDTLFCPSRPFRFLTCRVYSFIDISLILPELLWFVGMPLLFPRPVILAGLFSCVVFSDYVHVLKVRKIVNVYSSKCCSTARKCFLDHTWPFLFNAPSDSDRGLPLAIRHF